MQFADANSLMAYRASASKTQNVEGFDCPKVQLYGVSRKLDKPVIAFTKMSKKYLYDSYGNKYPFKYCLENVDTAPVAVFTSEAEAWKFFKERMIMKMEKAEDFFITEMKIIKTAREIISAAMDEYPEYFI